MQKLLLVDDDAALRKMFRAVGWAEAGFEYLGDASDEANAVPIIKACQPDVVLLGSPLALHGQKLLAWLTQTLPQIKIVLLVESDDDTTLDQLAYDGLPVVLKPVDWAELLVALHSTTPALTGEQQMAEPLHDDADDGMLLQFQLLRQNALDDFLHTGNPDAVDAFFEQNFLPLRQEIYISTVYRHYLFLHLVYACAAFIRQIQGDPHQVFPDLNRLDQYLPALAAWDQFRQHIQQYLLQTVLFRAQHPARMTHASIQPAVQYMQSHYANPQLSLTVVAQQTGLSPHYFSTRFKESTGSTFRVYLTTLRLQHAKRLLKTTALKVHEIARACGIKDVHYFCTLFKRDTGLTPLAYRQQN